MKALPKHCVSCGKGAVALTAEEVKTFAQGLQGWSVSDDRAWLHKSYKFKNFAQALSFTNKVGAAAEAENHHPDLELGWGYVKIKLQTHSVGGLHENDFVLAAKIDEIQ